MTVEQTIEQTLAIIKPDAVTNKNIGKIIQKIEENNFDIQQIFMIQLTKEEAGDFYYAHKDKGFFNDLTDFMSSTPITVIILEKENAIQEWRDLMGATDPAQAAPGTIRAEFAKSIDENSVHGSDSIEAALEEISFFFEFNEELAETAEIAS